MSRITWKLRILLVGTAAVVATWGVTLYWTLVSYGYLASPW
jgi:hypothetical protein